MTDASRRGPESSAVLVIGIALALTPALVLVVVPGLVVLIDDPPLTISELTLFELETLILWVGIHAVALFVYYRRKGR